MWPNARKCALLAHPAQNAAVIVIYWYIRPDTRSLVSIARAQRRRWGRFQPL
jgi:hypothetical protein